MDADHEQEPAGAGAPVEVDDADRRLAAARDLESKRWVVRTPDEDRVAATVRLATVWPLLRMWSVRHLRLRFRQSALGLSWTIFQPVAILAIYGFVFTQFLDVSGDGLPYLSVAWAGLTVWMFIQAAVQGGTISLRSDAWILSKIWFPREVVPIAPVFAGLVDLAVAFGLLLVVAVAQGVGLSYHIVATPIVLAVIVVWATAVSVFAATVTVFFRDLATIVALGLRLGFISTPIMYPSSLMPEEFQWLTKVNPVTVVIDGVRDTVLVHTWPSWRLLALHGLVGVVLLVGALRYLRAVERRMVDII